MLQEDGIFGSWPKIFGRYSFKLHPYGSVIQPDYQICKTLLREIVNGAAILQGARARQTNAPFINQETVKAVLSQTLDQSKLIIINCGKFSSSSKDVDVKLHEISRYIGSCLL